MKLRVVPLTLTDARRHVEAHHSHHSAPIGGLYALGVAFGETLCCVAIVGRPVARMLAGAAEVTRLASDGTKHAASMALGAATRARLALGWRRFVSYTLIGEAGTSYRAAGWWPVAVSGGGEWSREDRPRDAVAQPGRKVRWEYGPEALPRDADVDALVRASVGTVALPPKVEALPLWRCP